jgi:four helix bundle protein
MSGSRSFENVDIWQKAHEFVLMTYRITETFPKHELFCLTSQLRRAAISIPANFAEGYRRESKREKVRFYNISIGSLEECRYYLRLAKDLGYSDTTDLRAILESISKMLTKYAAAIRADF